jgi:hypothetical protein
MVRFSFHMVSNADIFQDKIHQITLKFSDYNPTMPTITIYDEGMTDGPPTFAYLVFGPGRGCCERLSRPVKAVAQCGPGAILGAQARIRGVQVRLGLG